MKACISDKRRYLSHFFLFLTVFLLLLSLLISLGRFLSPPSEEVIENSCITISRPIVVIDAGHGGEDGGTIGVNGVYEKDLNLKIALLLDEWLRAEGIDTVLTRSEDILLYDKNSDYFGQKKVQDLAARRKIAEQYDDAILISIHMNAFPEAKYSGLQVYYSQNNPSSQALAAEIQAVTRDLLIPDNTRKIKPAGKNIYLLDRLTCPAVLIECGFLSNPEECSNLSGEEYQKKLAFSIYLSIVNYLNGTLKNHT
ncbi:MAG: N-acetylmuramoyl-L-alanine amidase [Clostridia bacterium]|nr:N-acetylmuramoyl-L-alanine amidase [Clostridia bacterium]